MSAPRPQESRPRTSARRVHNVRQAAGSGRAQLSLVEHALCPVDPRASLRDHLVHETTYGYTDRNGHLKLASVRVISPSGLSPADEFVLWGLLALTFAQPEPSTEFHATPHYCLRQLGLIESNQSKGGKDYRLFRETVKRLARVIYENSAFYDAIRGEHRDVAFGFLKYSLPIDARSSRAWRFVWDQQFFELSEASGGALWFDLATYRRLDFASRRLFVLLQKIFHRSATSPAFDVRHLCVDVLGFSGRIGMKKLKQKLQRCLARLAAEGIIRPVCDGDNVFAKQDVGQYSVKLTRGEYFNRPSRIATTLSPDHSPLVDPLRSIGLDEAAIHRILRQYRPKLIREWADITLAARERQGEGFFKKSAAAYFVDNLQEAAANKRTPPDWWRTLRQEELRREQLADREQRQRVADEDEEAVFRTYLEGEAREAFNQVMQRVVTDLVSRGKSREEAEEAGTYMTRLHFLNRFRKERPGS